MVRTLGVTGPQRFVLRVVGLQPGISSGELAQYLHLHPSTLTGVLQRLDDAGLLKRTRDRADARRVLLKITGQGRRVLARKGASVEAVVRSVIGEASAKELASAVEVLGRITTALEETPLT